MKPRISFWTLSLTLPLLLVACGGGSGSSKTIGINLPASPPTVSVQSAGPTTVLPKNVIFDVSTAVRGYVRFGTMGPLKTGTNATHLPLYFTADALGPATGKDADILLDQQFPKATTNIDGKITDYKFTGLTDPAGNVSMVAVELNTEVKTKNKNGDVIIKRDGNLVVVPDGKGWKIGAYNLNVSRSGAGVPQASQGGGK